jgi:nitroreductase
MDVKEAIKNRRTIRDFKDEIIPDDTLLDLLETARWSPSPVNSQPWKFIIIRNKETLKKLKIYAKYGGHLLDAPMAIAVVVTHIEGFHWYNEIQENRYAGAVVATNLMLAAWERGIGTGWVSIERDKVNEILQIPEGNTVITIMPIGYPVDIEPHSEGDRKPLEWMVFAEQYGERFPRIDSEKVKEKWKK